MLERDGTTTTTPGTAGDPRYDELIDASVNAFVRLDRRAQLAVLILLAIAGVVAAAVYYQQHHRPAAQTSTQGPTTQLSPKSVPPSSAAAASIHMPLGNPSGATPDPANRDNYLELKPYYALAYNNTTGTPNWVSWRVTADDLGDAPRKPLFDADNILPPGFKVVVHKDYSGSGFDRGHLCPHSDRAATREMSYATFVMTNIIPQAPNVNQKAWAQFEIYCRDLVRRGNSRLYVIAGPQGRGGRGTNGPRDSIGASGKVTVPARCWKIVVVLPAPPGGSHSADDLAQVTPNTRVIAIDMPNDNDAVGEAWTPFRTTPAQIEAETGYHFFDRLPPDVAESLRQKRDGAAIPPPTPMNHAGD